MSATQLEAGNRQVYLVDRDVFHLAKRFLQRQERAVQRLQVALRAGDFAKVCSMGHDLKGSGGAYGMDKLSALGRDLEAAAGEKDVPLIAALLEGLENELSRVELRAVTESQEGETQSSAPLRRGT